MCSAANLPQGGRYKEFFPLLKAAYNVSYILQCELFWGDYDGKCNIMFVLVVTIVVVVLALMVTTMHQGVLPFKYKQIFKILEKKASGKLYGDNRSASPASS